MGQLSKVARTFYRDTYEAKAIDPISGPELDNCGW